MHLIITTWWGEQWLRKIHHHLHTLPTSRSAGTGEPQLQWGFEVPFPASGKSYAMRPPIGEASKVAASGFSLIYQKSASQNDLHFSFSGNIWFHPPVGFRSKPGQGSGGRTKGVSNKAKHLGSQPWTRLRKESWIHSHNISSSLLFTFCLSYIFH